MCLKFNSSNFIRVFTDLGEYDYIYEKKEV